jgi:hypothetical protein
MGRRFVIERLSEGTIPPAGEGVRKVDAPSVTGIRLVFGVGAGDAGATDDTFKPVYTVSIPVFSLGGLDADGVYEFDATSLLTTIQKRSQRRRWSARLEIEIHQRADTVASADIHVDTPLLDGGPTMDVLSTAPQGTPVSGGGRSVVLATSLVHEAASLRSLAGTYRIQYRDSDPREGGTTKVESPAREVRVELTRYEFEG